MSEDGPVKVVNHDKLKPYSGDRYPKWGATAVKKYKKMENCRLVATL